MAAATRKFAMIVAATRRMGIGLKGALPWRLKAEMEHFRKTTTDTTAATAAAPAGAAATSLTAVAAAAARQNAVIMGRKTWSEEGVPAKYRPLSKRINIVLTKNPAAFREQLSKEWPHAAAAGPNAPKEHVHVCSSLPQALELLGSPALAPHVDRVFVIGGGELYTQAMSHPDCNEILFTRILSDDLQCDTFFPAISPSDWQLSSTSAVQTEPNLATVPPTPLSYQFETYTRIGNTAGAAAAAATAAAANAAAKLAATGVDHKAQGGALSNGTAVGSGAAAAAGSAVNGNASASAASAASGASASVSASASASSASAVNREEQQYLDVVRDVIDNGVRKSDRTGVGTVSKFGCLMRFSLRNGQFPLLTTKQVYWKGVAEELFWMLRGCTDSQQLSAKKVKIWDDNGSRAFLDKSGFQQRAVGDLGPVYGFQWRHFGAKYVDAKTDYTGQGFDQIADVMHQIKHNPDSRRILFSAWNPADLKLMALPPCHVSAQFTVANGELSCLMYQRSCDLGLGVPFNIASYALLTVLMAHACGLRPGDFVHTLGDHHVYLNHIDPLKDQLTRVPRPFPTLTVKAQPKKDLAEYTMDDLELTGYQPYGAVKMAMAV